MSFRGRNSSRFRRAGNHDKSFRGRGRSNDRFHRRDFERQYEVSDRGRRGRGFPKHFDSPNFRSPRSHHFKGRYQYSKNRGRKMDSVRHFEGRKFRRVSPSYEEEIYMSDDNQEFDNKSRRPHSPVDWLDYCDDDELLEECTRRSNGRSISPLIIHRNFEREDYENARERSLERRERSLERRKRSPLSDRSRSLGCNPFCGIQERMVNSRSRSPLSMRSFRGEIHGSPGRPRSHLSIHSIRKHDLINSQNRSLDEGPGSRSNLHSKRYRREDSYHSHELGIRPHSFHSGSFGRRSPSRYLGRSSESHFSIRSMSFERSLKRERSFDRRSNCGFSVRSGSSRRFDIKGSQEGSTVRSRSPFSSHSRDFLRDSFKHVDLRSDNGPGFSFKQARRFERDNFLRDKSLSRCFSPARRQTDRERSFKLKSRSFKQQYHRRSIEHTKICHEKRSESSIERFLNDCKQSVEQNLNSQSKFTYGSSSTQKGYTRQFQQSKSPDRSLRKFKGLDHIIVERGKSLERAELSDEIISRSGTLLNSKDDFEENEKSVEKRHDISHSSKPQRFKQKIVNRLSPISSKSGSVEKTESSQHSNKLVEESNLNLSPISNSSIVNEIKLATMPVKNTGISNVSDLPTNEENANLSPISKSSTLDKIELVKQKEFENRLSPISSKSGSINGKEINKNLDKYIDQHGFNLSPISQSCSDKFSEKSNNFSPISQIECFEDDKSNDMLPTKTRKQSGSKDSMQEFLAELERDEINHDERSCSPKQEFKCNDPYKIAAHDVFGGWKNVHTTENKEKQSNSMNNYGLSKKAYFEITNSDVREGGYSQNPFVVSDDAYSNKVEGRYGKPYEQSNFKAHPDQLTYRPSETVCSNEQYTTEKRNFASDHAMKYSKISYPLRHTVRTAFQRTPQMPLFGPNVPFSTIGNAFNQSLGPNVIQQSKPNTQTFQNSSDQLLKNPYLGVQRKSDKNFNNMYSRASNFKMLFPSSSQNNNARDKLHFQDNSQQMLFQQESKRQLDCQGNTHKSRNVDGLSYQNAQYQQFSETPSFPPPHNFGFSAQAPSNNSLISTGNKSTLLHQDVNKFVPNSEMSQNVQMEAFQHQSKSLEFQEPNWHKSHESNPLVGNIIDNRLTTNTSLSPGPTWPNRSNKNQSCLAGAVGQALPHQMIEQSNQYRSNLKLAVDSVSISNQTVQNNFVPVQNISQSFSSSFGVTPRLQNNQIQGPTSYDKLQPTYNNNQSNLNLPVQKNPQPIVPLSTNTPSPIDLNKYLATVFGRNYYPKIFPSTKEVITISDDEDGNIIKSDAQPGHENTKRIMNKVEPVVPSLIFVEKYRDSPPSPEDFKQMFETFVIYFGVRNNSQLEKDPFFVIQESFSRSQNFGPLLVEENEEYHDFLPVPKQACTLRWNGVLLSKATCYSKEEARHKASISLINTLAHVCYTVQTKYSYYCGGKLPKFMLKKSEQPGVYKVIERDEIITAVTSTLKTLKEKNYNTGTGVDATHVKVVLGIIDDFFRDKTTFCELIFGSQGQSDYTIGELKTISTHVNRLSWLEWRTIGGFGRGLYTAVSRKKTPQELCSLLLSCGENQRYWLIPPQDPWIDLLQPNCQYNPNMKKL